MIFPPDVQALARASCARWRGTPHRNRIAIKGGGIDCIRFIAEVLIDAGVVDRRPLPSYPLSWGVASPESRMGLVMAQMMDVERIPVSDWTPAFGDICIFKVGSQSNHCGIVIDGEVWHVSRNHAVGPEGLEHCRPRLQEALRIRRPGWTREPGSVNLMEA